MGIALYMGTPADAVHILSQEQQASGNQQAGAAPVYPPEAYPGEAQQRRCSLNSRLTQINKQRVFANGSVSA